MVNVLFLDGPLRGKVMAMTEEDVRRDLLSVVHPLPKNRTREVAYSAYSTRYKIRWTAARGWVAKVHTE